MPHTLPIVHHTDADRFSPTDHADEGIPSSIPISQQEPDNQEQGSATRQEMTFEDLDLEDPAHDAHTSHFDSPSVFPIPSDRPWLGLQSAHSSHTNALGINLSKRYL